VEDVAQWQSLCRVIGRPDLATDPRYATAAARHEHRHELTPDISAWTSARTHYEAQEVLQPAGVPAAAVLNAAELLSDPHVSARHGFEYVEVPNVGPTPYPRAAFLLDRTPVPIEKAAPGFGEDNDDVFLHLLGMGAENVDALKEARITACIPLEAAH
jgi:formyl-CoA transferase/CoA:oxalate CoA-transferase